MARRQPTLAQQLGIGNDPVQPAPFSRANLQLRPSTIRGGGWTPAVPGTLSASETNLGRLAGALAQGGGLIGQIADLKAKKAEMEERGLAITHQTAMTHMEGQIADEKIKQLSMSLDMAEQTTNEAIVRKMWSTMSAEEYAAAVKENNHAVAVTKENREKALGEVAKENASMPLSELPPENRAVHHELMRGTAASRLFDAALKKHLLDWSKETGEKGEFITKGSEDFDARVLEFIKQHKADNEILEGSPADDNYNMGLRAYFDNALPAAKDAFLEANRKANLNNEIRLAAFTATSNPQADIHNPEAQQVVINGAVWKGFAYKKNNDEFDIGMFNLVGALIKEESHASLGAAKNWLNLSDADPNHDYRGGKFSESNPYKTMMAAIDAAEEQLDIDEVRRKNAKENALVEELEGHIIRKMYSGNAELNAGAEFGQGLSNDAQNGTVSTLIGLVGEDSDTGKRLTDLALDETAKLNNTIIGLLPTMQRNARLGGSQFVNSILESPTFSFAQAAQQDVNVVLDALPSKGEHENLLEVFGSKGETIGEYALTKKTQEQLGTNPLKDHERAKVNFLTSAESKAMRLRMAQKVYDDFVNDPANPKNKPPSKEEMRRLLMEEHINIEKAWPVIWAGHAQRILDEKAHFAKMEERSLQEEHAKEQLQKQPEEKTAERAPQFAWDLVKLARPLERRDDESLKNLTPGTPEFDIAARKLSDKQRERSTQFLKRWDHERKLMSVRESTARKEVTTLADEAWTGVSGEDDKKRFLKPRERLKKHEELLEATKPHAEAYRNLLGYGEEFEKILNVVKTGSFKGKEHGIGFIVAAQENNISADKPFNEWTWEWDYSLFKAREKVTVPPKTAAILQSRVDGFIPPDTFSVVLPPITNLPPNGAIRTATGKVSSIDLAAVRATLEAADSDLFTLAKAYGFAAEARKGLHGHEPTTANTPHYMQQRIITKFLTHQYNTPYQRAKFSISK